MNIVQYINEKGKRSVAVAAGDGLHALKGVLVNPRTGQARFERKEKLAALAKELSAERPESYEAALKEKRVLPPVTHDDPRPLHHHRNRPHPFRISLGARLHAQKAGRW